MLHVERGKPIVFLVCNPAPQRQGQTHFLMGPKVNQEKKTHHATIMEMNTLNTSCLSISTHIQEFWMIFFLDELDDFGGLFGCFQKNVVPPNYQF